MLQIRITVCPLGIDAYAHTYVDMYVGAMDV